MEKRKGQDERGSPCEGKGDKMTDKPSGSPLDTMNMNQFMSELDENSRQITAHLLRERHAEIRKLADLIYASSDMEVLIRIKEIINPKAQKIIGAPLITFERSKIDPSTGEKIAFSWWLNEELIDNTRDDKLLDILDEKNALRIIASLPLEEKDVKVEVKEKFLIISGKKYYQKVPLFCSVKSEVRRTINNGVLEVKLNKIG
jgi:HSP20 family molecular chaperone IbpA